MTVISMVNRVMMITMKKFSSETSLETFQTANQLAFTWEIATSHTVAIISIKVGYHDHRNHYHDHDHQNDNHDHDNHQTEFKEVTQQWELLKQRHNSGGNSNLVLQQVIYDDISTTTGHINWSYDHMIQRVWVLLFQHFMESIMMINDHTLNVHSFAAPETVAAILFLHHHTS